MNSTRPHHFFVHRLPAGSLALAALLGCINQAAAAPPANDDRANATVITGSSGRLEVTNVDATKEAGELNHAGNVGGRSIWFTFTATSTISTRIDTVGTGFDTLMSIYIGASATPTFSNDQLQNGIVYNAGSGGYTESRINFTATNGNTYFIVVDGYNPGTGALSGPIVLNWNQTAGAPAHDSFANAITLTGLSGGFSGRNQNATKETGEPVHAGNAGGRSVWYRWTPTVSGQAVIDSMGSSLDTLLAVYTGASVDTLTEVGSIDDLNNLLWHGRVLFDAVAGTTYHIAVDGYNAGTGSIALHYYLTADPPANDAFASAIVLPGSQGSVFGSSLNSSKEAGEPDHAGELGGHSVWYSWTAPADGMATISTLGVIYDSLLAVYTGSDVASLTLVPGASNDDVLGGAVTVSRVSFPATAGTVYRVAVDGWDGDYGPFSLNWDQAINAPTNDLWASAMTLPGRTGSITTSNTTCVYEAGEPLVSIIGTTIFLTTFGGKSLWFSWTATSTRPVVFDTFGSSFDTTLAVLTGAGLSTLTVLTNNDNGVSNAVTVPQSRIFLSNLVVGTTYYIQVDGANFCNNRLTPNGTVILNYNQIGGIPTNDLYANATVILGESGQTNGSTIDATAEVNEPEHAAISPTSTVWYKWTAPRSGWFTVDTLLTPGLDTVLAVYTGSSVDALTEVSSNDDATPGTVVQSRSSFLATAGTMYFVAVDSRAPTQGDFVLRWRPTIKLAATREPNNHLTLTITTAAPGFYELQSATVLPTWATFDSVSFTDPAGGTLNYDAGDVATPPQRFFRAIQ